jgi:hypothetical protein
MVLHDTNKYLIGELLRYARAIGCIRACHIGKYSEDILSMNSRWCYASKKAHAQQHGLRSTVLLSSVFHAGMCVLQLNGIVVNHSSDAFRICR